MLIKDNNDIIELRNDIIKWIQNYFKESGDSHNAIIGISGGKDSSVVASLCVNALGKERVIGVIMPNGKMKEQDIDYALEVCNLLGIKYYVIPITEACNELYKSIYSNTNTELNDIVKNNTPARLRMSVLYAISGLFKGRVANTSNLSESFIGYSTKFGDGVGDFSPLSNLTVTEVKMIGKTMLPDKFIEKIPDDGLCGMSDEEKIGFTYEVLDKYIRTGVCEDNEVLNKINIMSKNAYHKVMNIPKYNPFE